MARVVVESDGKTVADYVCQDPWCGTLSVENGFVEKGDIVQVTVTDYSGTIVFDGDCEVQ